MPVISPESVKNNNTSCYTCIGGPIAEMANYLRLVFSPNGQQKYAVDIYIGQNYKITFYDPYTQNNKTIIGTISGISNEAIAVYTVSVIDQNGNVCLCANKDNLAGYIGTETYHIPINNIQKIQLYTGNENPSERCETIVSILGISSTVIHSIIVRLRIFNDDVCRCFEVFEWDITFEVSNGSFCHFCKFRAIFFELRYGIDFPKIVFHVFLLCGKFFDFSVGIRQPNFLDIV